MQWSRSILVSRMNIRARTEQQTNRVHLSLGVPVGIFQITIGGVMQRLRVTMSAHRADIRTGRQQQFHELDPMSGGSNMQCRVARINPVRDFS